MSGTIDEVLMIDYLEKILIPYCKNKGVTLLFLDSFSAHKTEKVNSLLSKNQIECIIIPPGTTSYLQPLDVSINAPFKAYVREEYGKWLNKGEFELTKKGNTKKANYGEVTKWVKNAFDKISNQVVRDSFDACGISLNRKLENFNYRLRGKLQGSMYKDKFVEEDFSDWDVFNLLQSSSLNVYNDESEEEEEFTLFLEEEEGEE